MENSSVQLLVIGVEGSTIRHCSKEIASFGTTQTSPTALKAGRKGHAPWLHQEMHQKCLFTSTCSTCIYIYTFWISIYPIQSIHPMFPMILRHAIPEAPPKDRRARAEPGVSRGLKAWGEGVDLPPHSEDKGSR